jgi:tRNA-Thr(GGU) m(6)t(6)A37 methyltransferase TsaA
MQTSRRRFIIGGTAVWAANASAFAADSEDTRSFVKLAPIGKVEKQGQVARIRVFDEYVEGLLGLEEWSHVNVFYWFSQNDVPEKRRILQVHPRGNKDNPLTGVFACRAPYRPNLIALSVCKILSVKGNLINLESIDAFDGTPVLDLKPFIPTDAPTKDVRVPAWIKDKK